MQKLKLDLDTLAVESFSAVVTGVSAGTIAGQELRPTLKTVCDSTLLESNPTCCPCTP